MQTLNMPLANAAKWRYQEPLRYGVDRMENCFENTLTAADANEALELDVELNSPAIRRLIEEVRAEEDGVPRSYNRTFNRHNR